jgi:hypothetical protein
MAKSEMQPIKIIVRKKRQITAWENIQDNDVLIISKIADNEYNVKVM